MPYKFKEDKLRKIKQWKKDNPDKVKAQRVRHFKRHREKLSLRKKQQYRENVRLNMTTKIGRLVLKDLGKFKNGKYWTELVGYSLDTLIRHLGNTMPKGYDWSDYMNGDVVLDHIIPRCCFNMKNTDDFRLCWSLDNLQLLTKEENIAKGRKIVNPVLIGLILNK